jgi:hypothetical protein
MWQTIGCSARAVIGSVAAVRFDCARLSTTLPIPA